MEVEQVMKTGRSVRSAHLQVKFASSPTPLRSAAVVPKALARKATARNTLRRALYRAIAGADIKACKGNAVFFVRLVPKNNPTAVFREELTELLPKVH